MTTEIELKYLILGDNAAEKITQALHRENIQFSYQEKQLSNCYFDTPALNLRHHDMGLRIRCCNGQIEQTIKTAGQAVGGLHSRPEYNILIDSNFPILSLFPNEIWHAKQTVNKLQHELIALFSTDFKRCTWLVTDNSNNVIELAYDQGEIVSGEQCDIIDELELELVQGDKNALFTLASLLFEALALRPGLKSKAARGYALWHKQPSVKPMRAQSFICDNKHDSIAQAFTLGLNRGLTALQQSIECYLAEESLPKLAQIKESLALIRHGFWLFADYLSPEELALRDELSHFVHLLAWVDNAIYLKELTNKTGNYRKKLDFSKDLIKQLKIEKRRFPDQSDIHEFLHSSRFNQLQLSILQLFLSRSQDTELTNKTSGVTLTNFAQGRIELSLSEVLREMKSKTNFSCQQYIAQSKLLNRSLLTGTWLAGLFDSELRDKFRHPWLDLQQGISELQTLWIMQLQLEKLVEPPPKLLQWQQSKVDGLLSALNNTKAIAVAMAPYWLESR
ncbi:MAG: CYTH domain-containing protein [Cognaticolwellia sp.]